MSTMHSRGVFRISSYGGREVTRSGGRKSSSRGYAGTKSPEAEAFLLIIT